MDGKSTFDAGPRETLLDVVLDKMQKSGKTTIVSRIIYVAKFTRREAGVDHLKAFYSKLIDKYYQEGEVTGMLLAFPTCMAHLLEGKTSILMSILRDTLAAGVDNHRAAELRVISSTEDIPARCYSGYHASFVNIAGTTDTMDAADASTIIKTASSVNTFMRKLGASFVGMAEGELNRHLNALDTFHEDVPAQELLLSLTPAEDAPTLEEYLELFDSPVNVDLDSERVWPMPVPVAAALAAQPAVVQPAA